jgi:iron complex transport system ATP-binding protein
LFTTGSDAAMVEPGDLVVRMEGVTVRRGDATLLAEVDWAVELDERWVILGPNGAGKTTLLRLASAEMFPSSGTVEILGQRLGRVDVFDLRTRIGLSSAALGLRVPPDEIVRDVVISAGYAVIGRWRERYDPMDAARADELLGALGLRGLAGRPYGTLSEGERKRALIARSLMTDPELLLLDEPAAGLDLGGREELVARLADLAADPDAPAIVLVTHHVEEIPQGFSHCLILAEGQVVAAGLLPDVLTAVNLSTAFGQSIALEVTDGRYFARRVRARPAHRRRA